MKKLARKEWTVLDKRQSEKKTICLTKSSTERFTAASNAWPVRGIDFCYFTLKFRDLKSVDNIFICAIMAENSRVAMLAR
jgi:hypothetical protein